MNNTNPFNQEEFLLKGIEESANSIFPWKISARRLYHSGYLLDINSNKNDIYRDISNVSRMLIGMSIECYLKALYLKNGNKIHDGTKQKLKGSHNLKDLADRVQFKYSEIEGIVLQYLSMYIRVKGRYPIPLEPDDILSPEYNSTDFFSEKYILKWKEEYDSICSDIVKRLDDYLETKK